VAAATFVPALESHFFSVKVEERTRIRKIESKAELEELREEIGNRPLREGMNYLPSGRPVHYSFGKLRMVETVPLLLSSGSMITLLWTLIAFAALSLGTGAIAARRVTREVAVGSVLTVAVQWVFWIAMLGGSAMMLFTEPLHVESEGALLKMPPTLFLLTVGVLIVLASSGGARLGVWIREIVTRKTVCAHCGRTRSLRSDRSSVCPSCKTSAPVSRVRWSLVAPATGATLLAFFLVVSLVGPKLGFYYQCDFNEISSECKEGLATYREAAEDESKSVIIWREAGQSRKDRGSGVVLHQWKYVGYLSLLFLFAPFLVAWKTTRAPLPSAGATILLCWLGATLVAMIFLGFAQFEGVFMVSLRLHVLAGIPWCVAGAVGALFGNRLSADRMMAELEEELEE
jgi:hypothetical protein